MLGNPDTITPRKLHALKDGLLQRVGGKIFHHFAQSGGAAVEIPDRLEYGQDLVPGPALVGPGTAQDRSPAVYESGPNRIDGYEDGPEFDRRVRLMTAPLVAQQAGCGSPTSPPAGQPRATALGTQ